MSLLDQNEVDPRSSNSPEMDSHSPHEAAVRLKGHIQGYQLPGGPVGKRSNRFVSVAFFSISTAVSKILRSCGDESLMKFACW